MGTITSRRKNNISTTTIIIILLFTLTFLATFNSTFTALSSIGFIAIFIALLSTSGLLIYHYAKAQEISRIQLSLIFAALPLFLLVFIGLLNNANSRGFVALFQLVTIILFFIFACLIKWDEFKIKTAKWLAALFILLLPLMADLQYIGAHLTFALFFVLLHRKKSLINIVLFFVGIVLIYLTEARAVLILLASTAFTYIFWNFISKTRFRFVTFFLTLVTGLLSFIFLYPNLIYWKHFNALNDLVWRYTGGRLMSGRNDIWIVLTDIINEKPFLGHGTGLLPSDVSFISMSSHNLYIQTALQNGYLGLAALFVLLFTIWLFFFKSKKEYATRLSASFFVGILVYQSFEVVLTQNKMDTALMFWLIISVGISYSIYNKEKRPN